MYNQQNYPYDQAMYYNPQNYGYEATNEVRDMEQEDYRPDDAEDAPTSPPPSQGSIVTIYICFSSTSR